jgi:hypothetical protein
MKDDTKRSVIAGGAGAIILIVMFQVNNVYWPSERSTGEPSTGLVETTEASGTVPLAFAMMPEALTVECAPGAPTLATPDGSVTCCQVARMWQFPSRPPSAPTRVGWDCPVGWKVSGGQVAPE